MPSPLPCCVAAARELVKADTEAREAFSKRLPERLTAHSVYEAAQKGQCPEGQGVPSGPVKAASPPASITGSVSIN